MSDIVERLLAEENRHVIGYPGPRRDVADLLRKAREEITTLHGAMKADDERLRTAGERVGLFADCDTADLMADEIERLRASLATKEAETLERAAMVAETTAHEGIHESMWRNKFMAIADHIRAMKKVQG